MNLPNGMVFFNIRSWGNRTISSSSPVSSPTSGRNVANSQFALIALVSCTVHGCLSFPTHRPACYTIPVTNFALLVLLIREVLFRPKCCKHAPLANSHEFYTPALPPSVEAYSSAVRYSTVALVWVAAFFRLAVVPGSNLIPENGVTVQLFRYRCIGFDSWK
jgi:hypothetical protein